jgi:hypothetical protein
MEDPEDKDRGPIFSYDDDGFLHRNSYFRRREGLDSDGNETVVEEEIRFGYPKSYEKWGVDVVKAGYTLLPNHLIGINRYLSDQNKLTPSEMFVLIVILSNWWDQRKMPAASKKYIGERVNLTPRQVQRILNSLESKRVIARLSGGDETGGASRFSISRLLKVLRKVIEFEKSRDKFSVRPTLDFDESTGTFSGIEEGDSDYDDEIPF